VDVEEEKYIAAFCDPAAPEVFHAIEHRNDIYKADLFDVPEINASARVQFSRLLQRHGSPRVPQSGSILLLKGRAGSGKTHMMRVYRNTLHGNSLGYFGYLQLTTRSDNYVRYLLRGFVHSLEQPYCEGRDPRTGLRRLADALAEASTYLKNRFPDADCSALEALRGEQLSQKGLSNLIAFAAPKIAREEQFQGIHKDVIHALLCLLTDEPLLQSLAIQFLRTDVYSAGDSATLGGLNPRSDEDDALWIFEQLGKLMARLENQVLVLSVDQLEDIYDFEDTESVFRRAVTALRAISDAVPASVLVLACLEDYYTELRKHCALSLIDRIEKNPEALLLSDAPGGENLAALVARRLAVLYQCSGLAQPEPAAFPFPGEALKAMESLRLRDALDFCRQWQEASMALGRLAPMPEMGEEGSAEGGRPAQVYATSDPALLSIEQAWNQHHTEWSSSPPSRSEDLGPLLADALRFCSEELPRLAGLGIELDGPEIRLDWSGTTRALVVCNKSVSFGWLKKEIDAATSRHPAQALTLVRATPFKAGSGSETGHRLAELEAQGVGFCVIASSEWRDVQAMVAFRNEHGQRDAFGAWLQAMRPLTRLAGFRSLLALDAGKPSVDELPLSLSTPPAHVPESEAPTPMPMPAPAPIQPPSPPKPAESKVSAPEAQPVEPAPDQHNGHGVRHIVLGETRNTSRKPVTMDPEDLTQHAAFLGGSGCGKTTLAMRLIEGLLFRGIPVVLLDRKGDLVNYARLALDGSGASTEADAGAVQKLAQVAEISIFTPGHPDGNPIGLGLMPESMEGLSSFELEQMATDSAASLCAMMGYSERREDQAGRSLLKTALQTLAERGEGTPSLERLIEMLAGRDPALVELVGNLNPRSFDKLVQDLEVLRLGKSGLFAESVETLDPAVFFSPPVDGRHKARLTILSTQFLGGDADIEFWVAQLLMRLGRYIGQSPSPRLRGVLFFDEADRYMPAQRSPATKGPLENLLRRARSAGLGILLASQSPGDFDYKCRENIRSWFLGRIKEDTALKKMKPLLHQFGDSAVNGLPGQRTGQFVLAEASRQVAFSASSCLVAPIQQPLDTILTLARDLSSRAR